VSKNTLDIASSVFKNKARLEAFTRKFAIEETVFLLDI
jgi:hypothetical protein